MQGYFAAILTLLTVFLPTSTWGEKPDMAQMQGTCEDYKIDIRAELKIWESPPEKLTSLADIAARKGKSGELAIGESANLALHPEGKVNWMAKPERTFPLKGQAYAGAVMVRAAKSGTHRVAIGGKVWVDVVELKTRKVLVPPRFEMQTGCSKIFKVVEYTLMEGQEYAIQISSSPVNAVRVLLSSAPANN